MTQLLLIVASASLKEASYRPLGACYIPSRSSDTPMKYCYAVTDSHRHHVWLRVVGL